MQRYRTWIYGPVIRSTGVAWDIRRLEPYDIYLKLISIFLLAIQAIVTIDINKTYGNA